MATYNPGELLLVHYPFVSGGKTKRRASLVLLDTGDADVMLARMTTRRRANAYEVDIQDWQGAGLLLPCVIRLHKIVTIEKTEVIHKIGALLPADYQRVSAVLQQLFGNW